MAAVAAECPSLSPATGNRTVTSEAAGPNPDPEAPAVSRGEKLRAVRTVAGYRPLTSAAVVALAVAAALSGVGAGFILPIIELAQGGASGDTAGILAGDVLDAPRHGVRSCHHGHVRRYRGVYTRPTSGTTSTASRPAA